jgi:hypothetical protein
MKRIRTAQAWAIRWEDGTPSDTWGRKINDNYKPVVIMWTSDYRRMRAELRMLRKQFRYCGECIAPKQKAMRT